MSRQGCLSFAAAAVSFALATGPAMAQVPGPALVVATGSVAGGSMHSVGHPPDYDVGCNTRDFTAVLVIEMATGSALGTVHGLCGALATALPAGSCVSNLPARAGFTCNNRSGGFTRAAFTSSSEPERDFGFAELSPQVWFQVTGRGVGAG